MNSLNSSSIPENHNPPIIFTHQGFSDYLSFTLSSCTKSNPDKSRIFLGDEANKDVAKLNDWFHYSLEDLHSRKRDEFNAWFKWIKGKDHNPVRGGKDWLRYVFERWFCIEEFLERSGIKEFWHFDSDTMILKSLAYYEDKINHYSIDCTTQCGDYCMNGYIKNKQVVSGYCDFIINSFQDKEFLQLQQDELNSIKPRYAYTEMSAFAHFRETCNISSRHLETLFNEEDIWFDDWLAKGCGFDITFLDKAGKNAKALFAEGDNIYC